MTSPDTSLTNQCSFDTLVHSPVVLLSVYSDEGYSIMAETSVKFYCESVGWNRRNHRYIARSALHDLWHKVWVVSICSCVCMGHEYRISHLDHGLTMIDHCTKCLPHIRVYGI